MLGVAALACSLLSEMPVQAAVGGRPETSTNDKIATGKIAKVRERRPDPALAGGKPFIPPTWPAAASATVDLTGSARAAAKAPSGLPVQVRPADAAATKSQAETGRSQSAAATSPASGLVTLTVHDRAQATKLGLDGLLLSLTPTQTTKVGAAEVSLNYSGIAAAYGGSYGSRLRLVQLPACALTTPDQVACQSVTELPSINQPATATVSATVVIPAGAAASTPPNGTGQQDAPQTARTFAAGSPMVLAAVAGPSGSQGDYEATSLAASATWHAGGNTGDFGWSYPMHVPGVPGDLVPNLAIEYSSGSVDGRVASTNTQPSWVGEGFDLSPGFIERRYKSCGDDGEYNYAKQAKVPDRCWAYNNATVSWNGKGGELIQVDANSWKFKDDDGSRIDLLADTALGNGDNDGEYWRITTPGGTQYFFGRNRLPGWSGGKPDTKSTLTVPVYGNNKGEPCYDGDQADVSNFVDSWCQQAYRWNLDYVVDPTGNAIAYYYQAEGNTYGRNLNKEDVTPYDRGGWLDRIEYGHRSTNLYAKPLAKVDFAVSERCIPATGVNCDPAAIDDHPQDWPDVPWDLQCKNADGKCEKVLSPAFFTRKRLTGVTTSVLKTDGSYQPVDSWELQQDWGRADADAALLLKQIQHTGRATGDPIALPPVTFNHEQAPNRVDRPGDDIPPFIKYRLSTVYDESGGAVEVNYSAPDCAPDDLPSPATNTRRCFPVYWESGGTKNPTLDWFRKYVATDVTVSDLTGKSPQQLTTYTYNGGAAWHFDDDDGLTKEKYKTWSQWRGYGSVTTRTGGSIGPMKTESTTLFLRGMHGDRANADGSDLKTVTVSDGEGGNYTDYEGLEGFSLKTTVHDGPGGPIESKTVNTPWRHVTATRTRSWGSVSATLLGTGSARIWTALEAGGWRQTRINNTYETGYGMVTQAEDLGDVSTGADDRCTRTTYTAPNTAAHLVNYVARAETVSVGCAVTPDRAKQVVSDTRTYYDNGTLGAAPSVGRITKTEQLASHNGTTATYITNAATTYDGYGRPLTVTDAGGRVTTTAYTPSSGLPTQVTVTSPRAVASDPATAQVTITDLDPALGLPVTKTDPAGGRTDLAYDALGRLSKVWQPNRSKASSQTPNLEYAYKMSAGAIVAVGTRALRADSSYSPWAYTLYDGLLRPRQTQAPGPKGGRLITDTFYDQNGKIARKYDTYYATNAPDTALFDVTDGVESQIAYDYDGLGRPTVEKFLLGAGDGTEQWRTTTTYGGDRVHVDPPAGGTASTTISDARGQTAEIRQYHGDSPTGDYDKISYGYTPTGKLASVTDATGNTWSYSYDQRGRKIGSNDPDKGISTTVYDDLDRVVTTTDARAKTLWTGYDALSRVTETRDGSATGTQLTKFVYDTVRKGQLTSAIRYVAGQAYSTSNDIYDVMGRVTRTTITIPSTEGTLAGAYQFNTVYNLDGTVQSTGYPDAGGLSAEVVTPTYDDLNRITAISSNLGTYLTRADYSFTGQLQQQEVGNFATKRSWFTYTYQYGTKRLANAAVNRENQAGTDRSATYSYDAAGNITGVADVSAKGTDTQCFAFDYLRRLSEAWAEGDTTCTGSPSSTEIGGIQPYWHSYTYDTTGNRTKETQHGLAGAADTIRTYTYPPGGAGQHRLSQVDQTGGAGARTDTYTYDQTGNTATRKIGTNAAQTLTWDTEGHLEKITDGTKTLSYLYDASGNRLIRRDGTTVTLYLPGGMELKKTSVVNATRYYSLGGGATAIRTPSSLSFLSPDHQGTGQLSINGATQVVAYRRTLPFGSLRGSTGTWPGDHGFLGTGINDSTGLTHLGAREYDPTIGRFISVDPLMDLASPQQMHGYSYANNNPVTTSDPTGTMPQWVDSRHGSGPSAVYTEMISRLSGAAREEFIRLWYQRYTAWMKERNMRYNRPGAVAHEEWSLAGVICDGIAACDDDDSLRQDLLGPMYMRTLNTSEVTQSEGPAVPPHVAGLAGLKSMLFGWKSGKSATASESDSKQGSANSFVGKKPEAKISCSSFVPGTKVLMADGTQKSIEEIEIGDKVLATDPHTGKTFARPVTNVLTSEGKKTLIQITATGNKSKKPETGSVTATANHPIWNLQTHSWIEAGTVRPGTILRGPAGQALRVDAVSEWNAINRVHNLTIADIHTYYVVAGSSPILVHNAGICGESALEEGDWKHIKDRHRPGGDLVDDEAGILTGGDNKVRKRIADTINRGTPKSNTPDAAGNPRPGQIYEWNFGITVGKAGPANGGGNLTSIRVVVNEGKVVTAFPF